MDYSQYRSAFERLSYNYLKDEIEGKLTEDDAVFATGFLIGNYYRKDINAIEKAQIGDLLTKAVNSPIPFVAMRCREFVKKENFDV